jgi:PEP-CTERM motif
MKIGLALSGGGFRATLYHLGLVRFLILASSVVPFNPVQQDVMLQFDAFGDKLSLWAWPVGEPMPIEPNVVAFDNTYAEGPVGLISPGMVGVSSGSTTFRFVHVANTHIPEPSTFVLMILGVCGLLYARRAVHLQSQSCRVRVRPTRS